MKKGRVATLKEGVLVTMEKDHQCTLHVHHYCLEIIIPAPSRQKDPFSGVCELSVSIFGRHFFLLLIHTLLVGKLIQIIDLRVFPV